MKRPVAIALLLAAAAIPASAQRGGGHGGFSARGPSSAPAFHGGQSLSSPRFSSSRGPMSLSRPSSPYQGSRYPAGNRYPSRRGYPSRGIGYGYNGGTYIGYPFLDAPFDGAIDSGNDDAPPIPYAAAAPDPSYGYVQPQGPYDSEPPPPAEVVRRAPRPEPEPLAATTLIFKDGRSPETIHNYIATRSTLTVIDGQRHHDIPIADLDIPATVNANRDSGSGFHLPVAP